MMKKQKQKQSNTLPLTWSRFGASKRHFIHTEIIPYIFGDDSVNEFQACMFENV